MIDRARLLSDLQKVVLSLEKDLAERSVSPEVPTVGETLRAEYAKAQAAERTALSYEQWRAGHATQVAVAWVLSAVFARFLEDNGLVELPRLAGPDERLQRARDEHELYFRAHPTETDREYLLAVFQELGKLPGMGAIFLEQSPVFERPNWLSGDAVGELLRFFQKIDPATGALMHDFTDAEWDTRFLGDLYQDLSAAARKQYALLQTPLFVEAFILDRTLDPAIAEFGLQDFRMIDPACGSGHFLLGAFARILDRWQKKEPGTNVRALAQRALDAVHGVDINPYAIAIARFRLLLAAMKASKIKKLKNAPGFKFKLACGDSLIHGDWRQLELEGVDAQAHTYRTEDLEALNRILIAGYYHVVVANPPYIVPKDKKQNQDYRSRYQSCYRQYSMAVPFMERLFQLAVKSGFTGQITANSFMKREFGKKLIEQFFPKVDLTHVIDTSGAYIPGHGTPTVILFGRNRAPIASVIRTVMGIRGEPSTPEDALQGLVWSAILKQVDLEGSESEFVSVADSQRELFYKHPWSIGGGGATELKQHLEEITQETLASKVDSIGRTCSTQGDDVFLLSFRIGLRLCIAQDFLRYFVIGEGVRDWLISGEETLVFPYDKNLEPIEDNIENSALKFLWASRAVLANTYMFGRKTKVEVGFKWYEYGQFIPHKLLTPLSITFAFVATHNHFVLDRGGKVFNRSAPVIKLPAGATEDEHLALLGLLNSSTACFWMQQVFHNKGRPGADAAAADEPWEFRFEHDGTKLKLFPLPAECPLERTQKLDELAQKLSVLLPEKVLTTWHSSNALSLYECFKQAYNNWINIRAKMIALQEELDWQCYQLYKVLDEDLTYQGELPIVQVGQRAFEIILARQIEEEQITTVWFERLNATPITEIPAYWPEDYQQLVQKRIDLIKTDKNIGLLEQFQHKRRWQVESWEIQFHNALETWLLNRLESYFDFDGRMNDEGQPTDKIPDPTLISTAKLADIARQDPDFLQVGELYRNDPAFNVQKLVDDLVDKQAVPLLPVLRYKPTGLLKRQDWQHTWQLQRQEDAIDARTQLPKDDPNYLDSIAAKRLKETEIGPIPVPPKYATKDFQKTHYWKLRGKLDVPKERWVSFPHCEGPDGFSVIAWAGYNHLQLAQAISAYYVDVQERFGGSDDPRLVPLLGCLLELLPWLKQWHNDPDPAYNGLKMGEFYEGFIQDEARQMGKTLDDIRAWEPSKIKGKRKRKQS
ncbi:MAG: BREX-2 system adenine-specific DNA-methyltransferase PglX [Cyanobacteria bacterium J06635_1]